MAILDRAGATVVVVVIVVVVVVVVGTGMPFAPSTGSVVVVGATVATEA
jgi:hypothetical protein